MKIFKHRADQLIERENSVRGAEAPIDNMDAEISDAAQEYDVAEAIDDTPVDQEASEPSQKWKFVPPTREQLLVGVAFWGVILLGAILRFWGLGDRPLHHDESMHAYFSLQLMHNIENWASCFNPASNCYRYDPLLHGPFQFHIIALVYKVAQLLGAPDNGVNNFTARFAAASLGTAIVGLPYFLRDRLGNLGAWLACLLLAVSPSMVYFSRFTREDIYMACFTLLIVVGVARYLRTRRGYWLLIAAAAFALSYATKEATFLTVAIFGSFLGALIVWELGSRWQLHIDERARVALARYLPRTGAPIALVMYFLVAGIIAKWLFGWLKALSIYITDPKNTHAADLYVQGLKDNTVAIVPWIGILLGIYLTVILIRELKGKYPPSGRHGLASRIDPEKQPLLDTIVTMPWMHWFFALLLGWTVFVVLFSVLFTNIRGGIGDGIWQGIYYWLQQQQVDRGGQPWYYYFLLIPLYEQIGLVFGLVGIVRSLLRPTRFRLFLVYWFVGNVFLYSWAAEKMPWLMIHMTMPMMLLAAIGLEPIVVTLWQMIKDWSARFVVPAGERVLLTPALQGLPRNVKLARSSAIFGAITAILLLLPTLHNMYEVTYVHAADAPHEMMIYVQTTTDVNIVMAKIDALDQRLYGGRHQLPIGVMGDATWPFAWYLRDYTSVCYNFPANCPTNEPVILAGGDNLPGVFAQYSKDYLYHQYHMRTQWDQGYMMPKCVPSSTNPCTDPQPYIGVGPLLWLSYGDTPPPGATFNLGLAAQNVWQWWWDRKAIGATNGSYDMALLFRSGIGMDP